MKNKLYQYSWIEMSGGFDHLLNVKAPTEDKANKLVEEWCKSDNRNFRNFIEYTGGPTCIEDKYTKKYIKKYGGIEEFQRGLPIHLEYKNTENIL